MLFKKLLFSALLTFSTAEDFSGDCYTNISKLFDVPLKKMTDEELEHAHKTTLPRFQQKCPLYLELDEYEVMLNKELDRRKTEL